MYDGHTMTSYLSHYEYSTNTTFPSRRPQPGQLARDVRADFSVVHHQRDVRLQTRPARELGDAFQDVRRDVAARDASFFGFAQRARRRALAGHDRARVSVHARDGVRERDGRGTGTRNVDRARGRAVSAPRKRFRCLDSDAVPRR